MSMYGRYETDPKLETNGVPLEFGDFVVTVSRAGGSNEKWLSEFRKRMRPFRRAGGLADIEGNPAVQRIMRETFARICVLNWQRRLPSEEPGGEDKLVQGIEGPDGETLEFTVANVIRTFERLPKLYDDIIGQASDHSTFIEQAERGN